MVAAQGAAGGAASGAMAGSAFGPYGAAIGGVAGGLLGAFGGGGGSETTAVKPYWPQAAKDLYNPAQDAYRALWRYQMGIPQTGAFDQQAQGMLANHVGLNDNQWAALQQMVGQAQQPNPFAGAAGKLGGLIDQGGINPQVSGLAQGLVGGGYTNPAMAGVSGIASGAENGRNPYLDATYQQAAGQFAKAAVPALTSQFANAGRTGSNAYANALGSQLNSGLGQLATNIYGGGYATDRANQMSALGMQGQLGQQNVNNMLSGAGLYSQGQQQAMQGIALGGQAYGLGSLPSAQLYQAGTIQQQAPYDFINQAINTGMSMPSGSTTTQSTQQNPITGFMSGATGGIGMAGMLGLMGQPTQQAMLSDERLKTDKKKVGSVDIHDWRYLWEPEGTKHRGPMAQDVVELMPGLVGRGPGGYLTVPAAMVQS